MPDPDRDHILREVYEENKRVQERRFQGRPGRGTTAAAGILGLIAVAALMVVTFGIFASASHEENHGSPEQVTTSRFRLPVTGETTPIDLPPITGDLSFVNDSDVPLADLFDLDVRHVVIDAGHGGRDTGARGASGLFEKEITLDVARRLARRLSEEHGLTVTMTRTSDTTLTLRDRVETANSAGGDLFVSIHVNYFPSEPVYALETYYFGPQSDADALRLADVENRNADYTVAEFNSMVQDFSGRLKLQESRRLALLVQRSMFRNSRRLNDKVDDWGTKSAPFVVLLGSEAPGILAEIGVISNRDEEARLATPEYREQLSTFLEEGIVNYLAQLKHGAEEE